MSTPLHASYWPKAARKQQPARRVVGTFREKAPKMTFLTPYLLTAGARMMVTIHGKIKDVEMIRLRTTSTEFVTDP
jgi:hypothetical protein